MGDMADDYEYQEWQQNSRYHSELNPRGVKTSEDFVWTMRDGKKIKLANMQTTHIQNCIRMLNRALSKRPDDLWAEPDGEMALEAYHSEIEHNERIAEELQETIGILSRELKLRGVDTSAHSKTAFIGKEEK